MTTHSERGSDEFCAFDGINDFVGFEGVDEIDRDDRDAHV